MRTGVLGEVKTPVLITTALSLAFIKSNTEIQKTIDISDMTGQKSIHLSGLRSVFVIICPRCGENIHVIRSIFQ